MTADQEDIIIKEMCRRLANLYVLRGRLEAGLGLGDTSLGDAEKSARWERAQLIWSAFESERIFFDYITTHEDPPENLLLRFCTANGIDETILTDL